MRKALGVQNHWPWGTPRIHGCGVGGVGDRSCLSNREPAQIVCQMLAIPGADAESALVQHDTLG